MKEKPPAGPVADLEKARAARVAAEDAEIRGAILDITAEKKKRQPPSETFEVPSDADNDGET